MSWLPIQLGLDREPQRVPDGEVTWMDFGARALSEPFLDQTIQALRQETRPPAREIVTGIDALLQEAAGLAPIEPSGFIFHTSRCGSTLVANAARTAPDVTAISEPRTLTELFRRWRDSGSPYLEQRWRQRQREIAIAILTLFAHHPDPSRPSSRVIVKFPSVSTVAMAWVRRIFPQVPCLMMVRNPVEILVSALILSPADRGGWMRFHRWPDQARHVFAWDLDRPTNEMTREEFAARVQGRYLECALEGLRSPGGPVKRLDYREVNEASILEVGEFFGLEMDRAALAEVLGRHSKDATQKKAFAADSERKREAAPPLLRAAVNQWALLQYDALLQWPVSSK